MKLPFLVRLWLFIVASLALHAGVEWFWDDDAASFSSRYAAVSSEHKYTGNYATPSEALTYDFDTTGFSFLSNKAIDNISAVYINDFHYRYNNSFYENIYDKLSPDARTVNDQKDFITRMIGLKKSLGFAYDYDYRSCHQTKVTKPQAASYVVCQQTTQYDEARVNEQFVFQIFDDGIRFNTYEARIEGKLIFAF